MVTGSSAQDVTFSNVMAGVYYAPSLVHGLRRRVSSWVLPHCQPCIGSARGFAFALGVPSSLEQLPWVRDSGGGGAGGVVEFVCYWRTYVRVLPAAADRVVVVTVIAYIYYTHISHCTHISHSPMELRLMRLWSSTCPSLPSDVGVLSPPKLSSAPAVSAACG